MMKKEIISLWNNINFWRLMYLITIICFIGLVVLFIQFSNAAWDALYDLDEAVEFIRSLGYNYPLD